MSTKSRRSIFGLIFIPVAPLLCLPGATRTQLLFINVTMVGRNPSPPRRQRACAPCARVRAKCHFREGNLEKHICDRYYVS
ncbi:hypothetical protein HZ326_25304 [Fusarium oxysporum f. sp. albedinis]|nr:hypothetical protein HZ326_25304 [Fusarium oxysporum f. sp. albedinis]